MPGLWAGCWFISSFPGVWAWGSLVGLSVGLHVGSGWMLVVFSDVVVAFPSLGGRLLFGVFCIRLMPLFLLFRGGAVRFSFDLVTFGLL